MMQSLDIISVNLWNTLISLCNLLLIFLILKYFLYRPVKKLLAKRQAALDSSYEEASTALKNAEQNRMLWEEKLSAAEAEAETLRQDAVREAKQRSESIVAEAQNKADGLLRQAEAEAELTHRKAEEEIKLEIVDLSAALSEKILRRELQNADHRALIDSFIDELGENNDGNQ